MVKKKTAKNTEEFDRRFDDGEDIHDLVDMVERYVSHSMRQKNWSIQQSDRDCLNGHSHLTG